MRKQWGRIDAEPSSKCLPLLLALRVGEILEIVRKGSRARTEVESDLRETPLRN